MSRVMRQILVDYARSRGRQKRGGPGAQVTLTLNDAGPIIGDDGPALSILDLDRAMDALSHENEPLAQAVDALFRRHDGGRELAEATDRSVHQHAAPYPSGQRLSLRCALASGAGEASEAGYIDNSCAKFESKCRFLKYRRIMSRYTRNLFLTLLLAKVSFAGIITGGVISPIHHRWYRSRQSTIHQQQHQ